MMEIASPNYLPELVMEDPTLFHQFPMDSFADPLDELDFQCFSVSPKSNFFHQNFNYESHDQSMAPATPAKSFSTLNACASDLIAPKPSSSPSSQLISFQNFNAPCSVTSLQCHDIKPKIEKGYSENMDFAALISQGSYEEKLFSNYDYRANRVTRNPSQAQEHVIAERKRREKLSRSFIALSAIVPGLKKMDKASVLGDAIKYMKRLQERVQTLEEQATKKKVKRSILFSDDESSTCDENSDSQCDQPLPEIEVRVAGKDVLIKIQCDKCSDRAAMILGQLEKHHLTVHSSSFLPFGNNIIDVTIVAEMNKENCMTAKDLLGSLREVMRQFI